MSKRNRNYANQAQRFMRFPVNDHAYYYPAVLPANILETDLHYQRSINTDRVDKIVREFDPGIVCPLSVSHREGKYYVFNGGHTLAALKKVNSGRETFPVLCLLFENLTYEEEAIFFSKQRGIEEKVSNRELLNARVEGKDKKTMEFVSATEKAGLRLGIRTHRSGEIRATGKCQQVYKGLGGELYEETLSLIRDTWGGSQSSISSNMIGGVAIFLREFGSEYDRNRFIKKLMDVDPRTIRTEARRCKASFQTLDASFATVIGKHYNAGRGKGRILESRINTLT